MATAATAWVGSGVALAAGTVQAGVPFAFTAALVALGALLRRAEPQAYELSARGLVVRRRSGTRAFAGTVSGGHRDARARQAPILGAGGVYGYVGRLRLDGRWVRSYVTSRPATVLVSVGEERLAVSPADPDAFLSETGGRD
jgi:hypothetical protein